MFLVDANLAKAMFPAERAAGLVEQKNPRQQFPQAQSFRLFDESSDQLITDASASPIAVYVHRKFPNASITFPRPVPSSAGPADDLTVDLGNHRWVATSEGSKPVHLIFRSPGPRFEGGDAILDALIVNFSNRRSIAYTGGPNVHAVHVWTSRALLRWFR